MAATPTLSYLLSTLYRILRKVLKSGVIPQALAPFLRGFRFLWSIFRSRCVPRGKKGGNVDSPPRPKRRDEEDSKERKTWSEGDKDQYTVELTGEIISLDDEVSYSLYPFSGDGIRNASRSSQNLNASRTAHSRAVSLRSASRSNLGTHSAASASRSVFETEEREEGPYTIIIQPTSPTLPSSPTPIRRFSTSLPDLSNSQNEPQRLHHPLRLEIEGSERPQLLGKVVPGRV